MAVEGKSGAALPDPISTAGRASQVAADPGVFDWDAWLAGGEGSEGQLPVAAAAAVAAPAAAPAAAEAVPDEEVKGTAEKGGEQQDGRHRQREKDKERKHKRDKEKHKK